MTNRLDIILHRNQQSIVIDVLLAVLFLVAAMTTGLAMKTAVGQLSGVPVAAGYDPAAVTGGLIPCATLTAADPDGALVAYSDSHAAGASLPR